MKSSAQLTQQAAGYMLAAANAAKREAAENAAIMEQLKSVSTTTKVVSKPPKATPKPKAAKPTAENPKTDPVQTLPISRGEIASALFEAAPKPRIYVPQVGVQSAVQACRCTFKCEAFKFSGVCRQVSLRRHPGMQAVRRR